MSIPAIATAGLTKFYEAQRGIEDALGQNPLREGAPVASWGLLVAATVVLVAVAAFGLERRDVRQ